jgi:hypothetical protein
VTERILFVLEDDWEVRGNGLGSVAHLQHVPAVFLMDVARSLGIRVNFMVEVLQQLAYERSAEGSRRLRAEASLWRETVAQMVEGGHDVQLHLHPQWHRAIASDGFFRHQGSWNIADHPDADIDAMVAEAASYLRELVAPMRSSHRLVAFKAGAWALQPAAKVLAALAREGIRIVMGPGLSIRYRVPGFVADYGAIEEAVLPYCPDPERIERVAATPNEMVVLPMPYYQRQPLALLERALAPRGGSRLPDSVAPAPGWVSAAAPPILGATRRSLVGRLRGASALSTFDIAGSSFAEMRRAVDQIVARALAAGHPTVPVVLQSHTKGYEGNWTNVRRFLGYLVDRHGSTARFVTLTELWERRAELPIRGADVRAG